jgi:tetratricopeptide (TPR) repeat protein
VGRALLLTGKPEEAAEACRVALSLGPQDAGALQVVGDVFIDRDLYPQAIEILRRSVAADPTLATAHNSLGVALALAGRPGEAVPAFEAALRLDPTLGTDNRDRARAADRQAGARP